MKKGRDTGKGINAPLTIQPIEEEESSEVSALLMWNIVYIKGPKEEVRVNTISGKNNVMFAKELEAYEHDIKLENKAREIKGDRETEEGVLEAKKKANQLKDDIALVISIILILILTACIVFGKVKVKAKKRIYQCNIFF